MAEIKTLPMVLHTRVCIGHLSVLFFLDFLITEKQLSVLVTIKQAICAETGQFIIVTNIPSGNAGIKMKDLKTCMLFKIAFPQYRVSLYE